MPRVALGRQSAALLGQVLVDSGPLVALFNGADAWHERVVDWLQAHRTLPLLTTWPVATKVCDLLARRIHNDAALDFLRWCERGGIALDRPETHSISVVLRDSERFADLPFDLADASVAEAAARLRIRHLLTIDTDFDVYRDDRGRAMRNVLRV